MQSRILFVLKYWFAWILFFEICRILFLLKNSKESINAGFSEVSGSIWNGLKMDASLAAYLTLPVIIFLLLGLFVRFFHKPLLYQVYTGLLIFVCLSLVLVDMNLYPAWGYRIDASFLKYLSNPREVYASISHLPIAAILLGFAIACLVLITIFNRKVRAWIQKLKPAFNKWWALAGLVIIAAIMIIPLRGGLQLAPLNQSSVYFSNNNFANQAAINAPWNFMHALTHRSNESVNPFIYMDETKARLIVDSLFSVQHPDTSNNVYSKPNVILIIAESFTSKAIGLTRQGREVTPGFNKLIKQGQYYSNIYASGDRTDKGIVAILSGYPSQPTTSIIKTPSKASKLPMLPKIFKDRGYETAFYYGGELEFANMKAYLLNGGFEKFTSINDFNKADQNSKWGAHDGVVMERFFTGVQKASSPFFYTWLTLSSHEPFETPVASTFQENNDELAFLNSIHYTDSVIYNFVTRFQALPQSKNSIIVIVADHGHKLPMTSKRSDDFKIPLLILDGRNNQIFQDSKPGSQTDLASTLLSLTVGVNKIFKWSNALSDSSRKGWGYFCFNNGFGYAQESGIIVFDNVGRQLIEGEGSSAEQLINRGKAVQQITFSDYLLK